MYLSICRRFMLLSTALAFALASPVSASVIFSDDFDSGASPLWGNQFGNWTASGGVYFAQSPTNSPLTFSLLPFVVDDAIVDVDVNGASDGGIWLRANADRSTGVILIVGGQSHSGRGLYWHIGPNYGTILNPSASLFNQGDNVHVQIVVSGDTYAAYLNGSATPATTLVTSSVASGFVGLYDFTGHAFGRQQDFDNFVLSTAAVPEPFSALLTASGVIALLGGAFVRSRRRLAPKKIDMNTRSRTPSSADEGTTNWRRAIAPVVIAVMLTTAMPKNLAASWRDNSGNLPGLVSGKTIAILAITLGGAAAGAVILLKRQGRKEVKMRIQPPRFATVAVGQSEQKTVSVTNLMGDPITIKEVSVESESATFSLADARQTPFTVAPREQVGINVTYSPDSGNPSKGQLRIVASSLKTKKDTIKQVPLSSPGEKSERRFLLF